MCSNKHKTALSALQPRSTRPNKTTPNRNSARKTRTKTRKQKFISLRRNLTRDSPSPDSGEMNHHQLDLFPLHPENLFEEKDIQDENVTCFFDSESGGGATLNGLLWGAGAGDDVASADEGSLTYARRAQDSEEGAGYEYSLERTALRNRERDASEEKWVCYSEVVEEVTSCSTEYWSESRTQGLSLKLDYQEIMDAWVDKGPLYIDGEGPAIVPDVLDDALQQQNDCSTTMKVPVMGNGDEGEVGQNREARVLRYKEKRQSRLFAKRIRYEVRKLNAEKRPRIKGRFVKRS